MDVRRRSPLCLLCLVLLVDQVIKHEVLLSPCRAFQCPFPDFLSASETAVLLLKTTAKPLDSSFNPELQFLGLPQREKPPIASFVLFLVGVTPGGSALDLLLEPTQWFFWHTIPCIKSLPVENILGVFSSLYCTLINILNIQKYSRVKAITMPLTGAHLCTSKAIAAPQIILLGLSPGPTHRLTCGP